MFDSIVDSDAVLNALREGKGANIEDLKQALAQLLMEYFTTFVNSFVRQLGYEHDGYGFNWDEEPTVDFAWIGIDYPTATINFGINVLCKEEDVNFFENLFLGGQFTGLYGQAIMAIFVHYLEESGIKIPESNVRFIESEFGHG